jgi:hypothetical protein
LVINSIEDSHSGWRTAVGFRCGRHQDPDQFAVIIATASIEMGVTFRAANLMFMEPGFAPMNFLQRYGRAARRGENGAVWVHVDSAQAGREPWLRGLLAWAAQHEDQQVSIHSLTAALSSDVQKRFQEVADGPQYFGSLPNRAVFSAGLYWNALLNHSSNRGPRRVHLLAHKPESAGTIYRLLEQVRTLERDGMYRGAVRPWCKRFAAQAYTLRDIGPRVRVVQGDGSAVEVEQTWLARETTVLECGLQRLGAGGQTEIHLFGDLEDYLLDRKDRRRVARTVTAYFPHAQETARLRADRDLVEEWCRRLADRHGIEGMAWEDHRDAMAAAERLVRLTGLVPCDDEDLSMAAGHRVL